jgi:hypothetical protein
MKDWLLQKGAEQALSSLLRDYGLVKHLSLNSSEHWCEIHLELHGEAEIITIRAENVTFRTVADQMHVRVGQIACSRVWLKRLGDNLVVGREFPLPPKAAAAVRLLL